MGKVRDAADSLLNGSHSEAVRYLIFGALNVFVTWGTYALLVNVGVDIVWSNAISIVIGVLFAFVCNKLWVFDSRSTDLNTVGREFLSFVGGRAFTAVLAMVLFPALYNLGMNQSLLGTDGFPAKIVTTVVEVAVNYVISKYFVFIKKEERPDVRRRFHLQPVRRVG